MDNEQLANVNDLAATVERSFAAGYCRDVVHAIEYMSNFPDTPPDLKVCFPTGSTSGQLIRVVHNWLEDHPEQLHIADGPLALVALQEAWPCKER